jgi:2-hydroxychromene-2-carboxylate isomerase
MGDVIVLREWLAARPQTTSRSRAAFFFDLSSPMTYLAAEQIERVLGDVDWVPTAAVALHRGEPSKRLDALREQAERRASELRLPLVWPDNFPADCPSALRAAAYAAEVGAGGRFALAASRLAFCGGFDLEDPEILAEAAGAAGLALCDCLLAAGDIARDDQLHATGRSLLARGIRQLPAIRVGRRWFDSDRAVGEAAAMLKAQAVQGRPLAPVG